MRFIIDENVRKEVVEFLKAGGHDIVVAASGSEDETIAKIGKENKRIILTHDQHFADILRYPPKEYSGIIRIKIHPPSAENIIRSLADFLQKPRQLEKKLVILEREGFRIR